MKERALPTTSKGLIPLQCRHPAALPNSGEEPFIAIDLLKSAPTEPRHDRASFAFARPRWLPRAETPAARERPGHGLPQISAGETMSFDTGGSCGGARSGDIPTI